MTRTAAPYCRLTIYESANRFYLVGSDLDGKRFGLLKIDRTESRELVFSNGDHEYTKTELNEVLAMIHGSNAATCKSTGSVTYVLNERFAKAKGVLGFVKFLEGYYMLVVTRTTKVAQLGFHFVYKIDETEMIYIPSKSDSQQNNAEEQRYVKLFQSVDLATDFYFSYTYDLTRTLQENVSPSIVTDFYEKFVWNSYLLEPMLRKGVNSRWLLPVIHGFLGACSFSVKGFTFSLLLVARRSNKFAGTRFLKRGANTRGYVANEVETEQILYDSSICSFHRGRFTSFVQLRGSVPLVWSQELSKVVGKPPIQLDFIDPFAVIPALHFQELRARYGNPVIAINLMKRRERRRQESVLNDEFRTAISYLNQFLDPEEAILYLSFDMARCHKTGNALPKLEEIGYNVVELHGWFQTFPDLYYHRIRPWGEGKVRGRHWDGCLLQTGLPRVNCVDCLDRTNVAQFVIGKVALAYQLFSLGLLDKPKLDLETEICHLLESLYEQQGDTLALQYAGSQLVHSIRTYKKVSIFQERSRDVIQTISRYYSNTFSDYDKQNGINLFLGLFRPFASKIHLWDLSSDWMLHNSFGDQNLAELDYCAWFELPEGYWKGRMVERQCKREHEEDSQSQLTDFDRYYRNFEMTSFDTLLGREQGEIVHIDSATSPATTSNQSVMKLWKKQEGNGGRAQDVKRGPGKLKTSRNGVEENEQDETSEDEEGTAAHSDTEIQYSTPWYTNSTPGRRYDATETTCQDGQLIKLRAAPVPNRRHRSSLAVYGMELKAPSKKDMLKYERYADWGGAWCGEIVPRMGSDNLKAIASAMQRNLAQRPRRSSGRISATDAGRIGDGDSRRSVRYETLRALSVFTNDNSFGVEAPMVSESAHRIYLNAVGCALEGPRAPSAIDRRIYEPYTRDALFTV